MILLWLVLPHQKRQVKKRVAVILKRSVARIAQTRDGHVPNETHIGHLLRNEMDTHADTSCAGANWSLMEYTGQVCEVSPFLSSYNPVRDCKN